MFGARLTTGIVNLPEFLPRQASNNCATLCRDGLSDGDSMNKEKAGMEEAKKVAGVSRTRTRTRSIAFVGLSIALMAVSAWVSIPLGPVPFTLQTFVMVFALLVLVPKECLAAIGGYMVLGAVGLPVFSAMRGGIGVLAGPTGGFLWGFLLGAVVALVFLQVARPRVLKRAAASSIAGEAKQKRTLLAGCGFAVNLVAGALFLLTSYACGWGQLVVVASLGTEAAFAVAVAPFLVLDAVKLVAAVLTAQAVSRALPGR